MIEYKYQKEFPRPFINTVSDISSTDNEQRITKVMDWKNYTLSKEFKNKLVDKLNDKPVMFDGMFFIGSEDDNEKIVDNIDDPVFDQKASADNCYLYFVDFENMITHKICLMRGWGHLTGTGALNLDQKTAADIQDGTLNWICETLNIICNDEHPVKYRKVMPDEPEEGINAQYDEFFNNISNKKPNDKDEEVLIPFKMDDDPSLSVTPVSVTNEKDASLYDSQTCWYYQNMPTSKYVCDKKSKKPAQPWYVSQINRNHNKKHK